MQGDFSRLTFDPRKGYRSVLLQQGRVMLDADWNEQAVLTAYHDEVRARDILGFHCGPDGHAGFGVVDVNGTLLAGAHTWNEVFIGAGSYYVDGILCELGDGVSPIAPSSLPHQGSGGLTEPIQDGNYVLYADVWSHHVTADEDESLAESALGGSDTTTRIQTVWQVRLKKIDGTPTCASAASVLASSAPGRLTASLKASGAQSDVCAIAATGGYTRLENQLYRVQFHDSQAGTPRFLWSRENGSVVAKLVDLTELSATGAVLAVDRSGRDDDLSIGPNDLVEVTSADRVLRGEPGFLAKVGIPTGLKLPVSWEGAGPAVNTTIDSFGAAPVVRRWEGALAVTGPGPFDLEGGIQVAFTPGAHKTGDYWLIPARAVQLGYGVSSVAGTIEWPMSDSGPVALPPFGPQHRLAPLAVLTRAAGKWSVVSDCRHITRPLADRLVLDLVGGDGQQGKAGVPLRYPIRFAVRNGGRPVAGERIRFTASNGGTLKSSTGAAIAGNILATDPDGIAAVQWTLGDGAETSQTLTAERVDGRDVPVQASGRIGTDARPLTTVITLAAALSVVRQQPAVANPGWTHTEAGEKTPTGATSINGLMPVALPDGFSIASFQATGRKMPAMKLEIRLQSRPIEGEDAADLIAKTVAEADLGATSSDGKTKFFKIRQDLTTPIAIDNKKNCYFVAVNAEAITDAGAYLNSIQFTCKPV